MQRDALTPFRSAPGSAGIFLDFDGTLSEIVEIPSAARPLAEVRGLLASLARTFAVVSIVSGRSAYELVEWLGTEVEIWGVHGAQRAVDGNVTYSDRALPHQELMALVRKEAEGEVERADLPGVLIEDKGVMIGLHFRAAEDQRRARDTLDQIAEDLARKHGLNRAGGRLAFELRPPVEFSKAAVVLERARDEKLQAALFIGDDKVDLPAFDALDILGKEGMATARVAVDSSEAPPELLERADVIVEGPAGVVELLKGLVPD
ncbi:MAG: trehalose 6-phosphate phosphatase [Actinomycetota bacterium]|nr:trehalose 6-phosphate phosphatase [Actinomycetota bacterium]